MAFSLSNSPSNQLALQGVSSFVERFDQLNLYGIQPSLEVTAVVPATRPLLLPVKIEAESDAESVAGSQSDSQEQPPESASDSDSDWEPPPVREPSPEKRQLKRRRVEEEGESGGESGGENKVEQIVHKGKFMCPGQHPAKPVTGCLRWPVTGIRYCEMHFSKEAGQLLKEWIAKKGEEAVVAVLKEQGVI